MIIANNKIKTTITLTTAVFSSKEGATALRLGNRTINKTKVNPIQGATPWTVSKTKGFNIINTDKTKETIAGVTLLPANTFDIIKREYNNAHENTKTNKLEKC
tara:strand:- start:916 stop:1224 length:309 start_codon:yes stop_codon:yes gene_type:complete